MKTLVEQINDLSYNNKEINSFELLKMALKDYHSMIRDGRLVPRGNMIGTLQNNIINYNVKKTNLR